jgi:hypothetical protein
MKAIFPRPLALLTILMITTCGRADDKVTGDGSPQAGVLVLESASGEAQFQIVARNGFVVKTGKTPAAIRELSAGPYNVTFRQSGCAGQRYVVNLGPEQTMVKADFTVQQEWISVEAESQKQEIQINIGNTLSQSVGPHLLRDLALASLDNDKIKDLLKRHGYNVAVSSGEAAKQAKARAAAETPAPVVSTPAPSALNAPGAPAWRPSKEPVIDWDAETEKQWKDGVEKWRQFAKKREVLVKQSIDIQTKVQEILVDLLVLAKTDDGAREIVTKYNIKQNGQN